MRRYASPEAGSQARVRESQSFAPPHPERSPSEMWRLVVRGGDRITGVRVGVGLVEDNCLVTPDGCENLGAKVPRTIEEIEEEMRGR